MGGGSKMFWGRATHNWPMFPYRYFSLISCVKEYLLTQWLTVNDVIVFMKISFLVFRGSLIRCTIKFHAISTENKTTTSLKFQHYKQAYSLTGKCCFIKSISFV